MSTKKSQIGVDETPPATTPRGDTGYKHAVDQDYAISILLEMQKSLGKVENAVETLTKSDEKTREKLSRIEKVMYAAGVILVIAIVAGGWMITTLKDFAMT